jgi:hypothetical protein
MEAEEVGGRIFWGAGTAGRNATDPLLEEPRVCAHEPQLSAVPPRPLNPPSEAIGCVYIARPGTKTSAP